MLRSGAELAMKEVPLNTEQNQVEMITNQQKPSGGSFKVRLCNNCLKLQSKKIVMLCKFIPKYQHDQYVDGQIVTDS